MADGAKSGRRHNAKDQAAINKWHKAADELKSDMADLGAAIEEAQGESEQAAAKGDNIPATDAPIIFGSVKAAGDWTLDVLYLPYGGPQGGKDAHGEYFSPRTDDHAAQFPNPLILYYHGHDENGKPQGAPEVIGKTIKRWADNAGRWVRVQLDRASSYAKRMWESAQAGKARASSGSIAHLVRTERDGHITNWPVVEVSLIDADGNRQPANQYAVALPAAKALYEKAGQAFPELSDETETPQATGPNTAATDGGNVNHSTKSTGVIDMDETQVQAAIKAALEADRASQKAQADAEKAKQDAIKAAVAEERKVWEAEAAKRNRLPFGGDKAPVQTKFADTRKYDGLKSGDLAVAMTLLTAARKGHIEGAEGFSPSAVKALAIKIAEDKDSNAAEEARQGMKAVGIDPANFLDATKANELDYSTQAGFGDEWAGVLYSRNLWEVVRAPTSIVGLLPTIEVPQAAESVVDPLEAADPTFYKVAQTTDHNATTGIPDATVTASKLATSNVTHTVSKGGARTGWSGEMDEDSVIVFASQLRTQLEKAAAEQTEHLVIDGDTQTSSASINDSTGSLTTNLYLLFNGFRKSPLVTTTANSRSAGGSLTDTDFLATAQLMGTAGLLGADRQKTIFIVDANTQWKAAQLLSVKTRDVFSNPTLENGMLMGIWGYKVYTSYFMHYASAKRMAQTTGKIHTTDSNNTTGAILAVRPDQWKLAYKRRITMEVTRYPRSDSSEIVALFRIGLKQRDTEASAITYNVGL